MLFADAVDGSLNALAWFGSGVAVIASTLPVICIGFRRRYQVTLLHRRRTAKSEQADLANRTRPFLFDQALCL